MKSSVQWHENVLKNRLAYAVKQHESGCELVARAKADVEYCEFYAKQIAEAKKRGMDAFDGDRLMVKRGEKGGGK